jgi:hypothetical protein
MSATDATRLDVKLYFETGKDLDLRRFMPIMQGWIQQKKLPELLLDVADYTHVHDGPAMLLVAHEAHYAIDGAGGRLGLLYSRRRDATGSFAERLEDTFPSALRAARLVEDEPALAGAVRFSGSEALLRFNDRLAAPNTRETFDAIRPALEGFLAKLYAGAQVSAEPRPASAAAFAIDLRSSKPATLAELARRLG